MKTKRSHEGELFIDHRFTPGLTPKQTQAQGLPVGAGQGLFETPTYTCSHCPRVVIMNPKRTRPRERCRKCDHYLCDRCGAIMAQTKECKTYKQFLDELQEKAFKEELRSG